MISLWILLVLAGSIVMMTKALLIPPVSFRRHYYYNYKYYCSYCSNPQQHPNPDTLPFATTTTSSALSSSSSSSSSCLETVESTLTSSSASSFGRRSFLSRSLVVGGTSASVVAAASVLPPSALAAAPAFSKTTVTAQDLVSPNSLEGQVIVITGATTGLGLESAKALATGGATVVLTCRTVAKGDKAVQLVQDYLQSRNIVNDQVYSVQLDLDNLKNVKTFPQRLEKALSRRTAVAAPTMEASTNQTTSTANNVLQIDTLLNNAGVMAIPNRQLTVDGYERTFQSNHLGHFVLTAQLAPYLKRQARIINVSSLAYQIAGNTEGLNLNNLNGEKEYDAWGSYGQSKLENILFTQELQRRVDATPGLDWTITSVHPGMVNTDLARNMMGGDDVWFAKKQSFAETSTTTTTTRNVVENLLNTALTTVLKTPEQGAATQVYLAVAKTTTTTTTTPSPTTTTTVQKGQFYSDLQPQGNLPSFATDVGMARALWEQSEELANIQFHLP